MENLIMNRNGLSATVSNIGCQLGDETFMLQEEAHEYLQTVWTLLSSEDPTTLSVRRHLGALSFGPKVLVPLLQYVFDDCNSEVEERESIFIMACKFLVALTEPISVLVKPGAGVGPSDPRGQCSALEKDMGRILQEIRAEFLKPDIHHALFTPLLERLRKTDAGALSADEVSAVNCMLYIYRNLLTCRKNPSENLLIVGLMFQGGFQECCHLMFSRPEMNVWSVAFVQLLPIIFCNECDLLVEQSEGEGGGEGSMVTKTLMYELSELSSSLNMDIQHQSTAMSISSSSDPTISSSSFSSTSSSSSSSQLQRSTSEDDGTAMIDNKQEGAGEGGIGGGVKIDSELFNQSFENMDDAMVDNLMILLTRKNLRMLAEDFIQNAMSDLLYVLKGHLLCGNVSDLPATYVGWVIHYFLSFSKANNIAMAHLKEILSIDMIGFLVYEICMLQETILKRTTEQAASAHTELEMCVRGLASIVDYISHFPTDTKTEDAEYIGLVKLYMVDMMNLGEMFVFLLRYCAPGPGNALLTELILLNHKFLMLAESLDKNGCLLDIGRHIENFASPDLMVKLFSALDINMVGNAGGKEVVSAVFTMAYHVVADHGRLDCIAQPQVLSTLCTLDDDRLLDSLSSEHIDLVNHVLQQLFGEVDDDLFEQIRSFDSCGDSGIDAEVGMETNNKSLRDNDDGKTAENSKKEQQLLLDEWSEEEISIVMDTYSCHSSAGVKDFLERLHSEKSLEKSSFQILYKLLTLDILSEEDFKQALSDCQDPAVTSDVQAFINNQEQQQQQQQEVVRSAEEREKEEEESAPEPHEFNDIIADVHRTCQHRDVQWLQQQLMEASFVLCGGRDLGKPFAEEPLYLYSSLSRRPLPIPVLTEQQSHTVSRPAIRKLLRVIGCDMDSGMFPRLPALASPVELYMLAKRLGPLKHLIEKVEETDLVEANFSKMQVSSEKPTASPHTNGNMASEAQDMSSSVWPQIVFMFNNSLKVN